MDRAYFEDYCGAGPYGESYRLYSGIDHCLYIVKRFGLRVRTVHVLGAATGEVVRDMRVAWRIQPRGCEISRWAHRQIPQPDRAAIACADMRRYVRDCLRRQEHSDLVFSNSLVYLRADEVTDFLAQCRSLCRYFHYMSSTSESYEPGDRYRVTLRPRRWWRDRFVEAGFRPTRSPYLYR